MIRRFFTWLLQRICPHPSHRTYVSRIHGLVVVRTCADCNYTWIHQ